MATRVTRPLRHASRTVAMTHVNKSWSPMRLERRGSARVPARGEMVATFRGADGRIGLTRVELVDSSDGGVGLLSPVAIEPGMTVTLRDARTRQPWTDAACVRCTREVGGYRVGLRLGHRLAA